MRKENLAGNRSALAPRGMRVSMRKNRANVWTLSVGAGVVAVACAMAVNSALGAGGGRGPAPEPKPTIMAPDADKGDSSKTKELPLVFAVENTAAKLPTPTLPTQENATEIKPFPDPFAYASDPLGKTRSTDYKDWEKHRAEIIAMLEKYEIGKKPAVDIATQVTATFTPNPPAAPVPGALGDRVDDEWFVAAPAGPGAAGAADAPAAPGGARRGGGRGGRGGRGGNDGPGGTLVVTVTNNGKSLTLTSRVSIPVGAKAPYPVMIGMNSPYGSLPAQDFASRGVVGVAFSHNDVTTYGGTKPEDPFFQLYPDQTPSTRALKGNTGQYAAWAWGVSRIIDGFTLVKDKFPVDMNHIAVTGCSYAGKMALFSGALDERVALTVSQESGGGGATNWRFSATEPPAPTAADPNKLSVEGITNTDHNWFASQLFSWGGANLAKLPEDHHMLAALVAPRALYVTGNTEATWLSNPSLYVNSRAAAKVYSTLGIADRFGYVVNGQHPHCNFPASQEPDIAYFLDRFIKDDKSLSKIVANVPEEFAKIDYARWTNWWGTGKADLPPLKEGAWK